MATQAGARSHMLITATTSGASGPINQLGRTFTNMVKEVEGGSNRLRGLLIGLGGSMTIAGSSIQGAFRPVQNLFMDTIKTGMDFEQQMTRSMAVISDGFQNQAELTKVALSVGEEYALSNLEAAEALEVMGKAGFSSQESIESLGGIVKFAEANNLDLAKATEIVAVQLSQFGDQFSSTGEGVERITGAMTGAALATIASVEKLATSFGLTGSVLAGLNINYETGVTVLAALAKNGIQAMKAATGLRGMLIRSVVPTKQAADEWRRLGIETSEYVDTSQLSVISIKNLDNAIGAFKKSMPTEELQQALIPAMEQLGFTSTDSEGKLLSVNAMLGKMREEFIRIGVDSPEALGDVDAAFAELGISVLDAGKALKNPIALFQELRDKLAGYDDESKNAILATMFTANGLNAAQTVIGMTAEEWDELSSAVENGSTTLDEMMARVQNTLPYALTRLQGNIESLKTEIYMALQPVIVRIVGHLEKFIQKIRDLSPEAKRVIAVIGAIGAVLGGIVGPIITVMGLLVLAFQALAIAAAPMLTFFIALGLVAVAVRKRFGDIVEALQPAIAAFKLLIETFKGGATAGELSWLDKITDFLGNIIVAAVARAARAFQILVDTILTIRQVLNGTWQSSEGIHPFTNAIGKLVEWFLLLIDRIKLLAEIISQGKDMWGFRKAFDDIAATMGNTDASMGKWFRRIVEVTFALITLWDWVKTAWGALGVAFNALGTALNFVFDMAQVVFDKLEEVLGNFANKLKESDSPILQWIGNAIGIFISFATSIGDILGGIRDIIAFVFNQSGGDIIKYGLLALGLMAILGGLAGIVANVAVAFAKLALGGPLKGFKMLNSMLGKVGAAFINTSTEKEKHAKNQEQVAQRTTIWSKSWNAFRMTLGLVATAFMGVVRSIAFLLRPFTPSNLISGLQTLYINALRVHGALKDVAQAISNLAGKTINVAANVASSGVDAAKGVASKTITITQHFVQTGVMLLDKIKEATSKTITMTQDFVRLGIDRLNAIKEAVSKTIKVTQEFITKGDPKAVGGAADEGATKGIGEGAGKGLAQGVGAGFGAGIAAALKQYAPKVASALVGLLAAAAGITISLTAAIVAGIAIVLVGAILIAIFKPEWYVKLGQALLWLFEFGIPYALGFAVGLMAEFAVQLVIGLIKALELALVGAVYLVAGLIGLLFSPVAIIAVALPPLVSAFFTLFQHLFITLPALIIGLILDFYLLLATTFIEGMTTLIGILSAIFLEMPLAILRAISSTLGPLIGDFLRAVISGDWGAAVRAGFAILKAIFITLPMEILNIVLSTFGNVFGQIGSFLSSTFSNFGSFLSGAFGSIAAWGGQLLAIFGNIFNAIRTFVVTIVTSIGSAIGGGFSAVAGAVGTALNAVWNVITTVLNAIWEYIKNVVKNFSKGFDDAFGGDTLGRIRTALSNLYDAVRTAISRVVDFVVDTIGGLPGQIYDIFVDIGSRVREGVTDFVDAAREKFGELITRMVDGANEILTGVTGFFSTLASEAGTILSGWMNEVIGFAGDTVSGFIDAFVSFVSDVVQFFIDIATGVGTEIASLVTTVATEAANIVSGFLGAFVSFVTDVVQFYIDIATAIYEKLSEIVTAIPEYGRNIIQGLLNGMQEIFTIAKGWVEGISGQFLSAIGDTLQTLYQKGWDFIQGLYNGLKDAISKLNPAGLVEGVVSGVTGKVSSLWKEDSPSKVSTQQGFWFIEGLAIGISKGGPLALDSAAKIASGTIAAFTNGFQISSPSRLMIDVAHQLIDGLIVGMDEKQIELAKKIAETVKSITDAVDGLIDFNQKLNAADIFPLDANKLRILTGQVTDVLNHFTAVFKDWKVDFLEELGKKMGPAKTAVELLESVLGLLVSLAENSKAIRQDLDSIGILKLTLEKVLLEIQLMYKAFGPELVDDAVRATQNVSVVTDALLGIIEVLAAIKEAPKIQTVSGDMFGFLKLAIERALIEFQLMYQAFGNDLIKESSAALANATTITDALLGIIEVLVELVNNPDIVNVDFGQLGQLKLAIERAFLEFQLMFNFLGEELVNNVTANSQHIATIAEGITAIVDMLVAIVENPRIKNVNLDTIGLLRQTIETAFIELNNLFLSLGEEVAENAEALASSIGPVAEAMTAVAEFMTTLSETVFVASVGGKGVESRIKDLARIGKLIVEALHNVKTLWLGDDGVVPELEEFSKAIESAAGALIEVMDFMTELLTFSDELLIAESDVQYYAEQLSRRAGIIAKEFAKVATTWDEEVTPAVEDFGKAAEASLKAIAEITDALEAILAFEKDGQKINFEKLSAQMVEAIRVIVAAVETVAVLWEKQAMEAIGEFSDNAGKALKMVSEVADAFEAMTGVSKITVKHTEIFKANFQTVLELVRELKEMAVGYLEDALEFQKIAEAIAGAMKAAAEAIQTVAGESEKSSGGSGDGGGSAMRGIGDDAASATEKIKPFEQAILNVAAALGTVQAAATVGAEAVNVLINNFSNYIGELSAGDFENLLLDFEDMGKMLLDLLPQFADGGASMIKELVEGIKSGRVLIEDVLKAFGKLTKEQLTAVMEAMASLGNTAAQDLFKALLAGTDPTEIQKNLKIINDLLNGVQTEAEKFVEEVTESVEEVRRGPSRNMLSDTANGWKTMGAAISDGIERGITDTGKKVILAVEGLMSSVMIEAENTLGIASPSTVFDGYGRLTIEGLIVGMGSRLAELKKAIQNILTDMIKELDSAQNRAHAVGVNISQSTAAGILSGRSAVIAAAIAVAKAAIKAANDELGISSPSKVFVKIGMFMSLGLSEGLQDSLPTAFNNMERSLSDFAHKLQNNSELADALSFMMQLDTSDFMQQLQDSGVDGSNILSGQFAPMKTNFMGDAAAFVGTVEVGGIHIDATGHEDYDAERAGLMAIEAIREAVRLRTK